LKKMDERASRYDKLLSIPVDHLLLMARHWVFDGANYNTSEAHLTKVLEAASKGGNNESSWLLDKLRPVPKFDKNMVAKLEWLTEIMATEADSNPQAQYYRGRALMGLGDRDGTGWKLLRQSAEAGFAPAMSWLGTVVYDKEERLMWLLKASELNDPEGMFWLSDCVKEGRFELLCKAVAHGYAGSMYRLAEELSDRLSLVEVAYYSARYILYSGIITHAAAELDTNNLAVMYVAGRELEGYDQFWDADRHPHGLYLRCIDVYLTIMHRARRAALQVVLGLRRYVGRDIARLIGQMVYSTRTEAQVWLSLKEETKKKQKF
jgi:TPR repeat protein